VGESVLVLGALAIYLVVRALTNAQRSTALAHARDVLHFERVLGLAREHDLQGWVLAHHPVTSVLNTVYVWCFWPILLAALVWLHRRSPAGFVDLRNALIVSGLIGLAIFALFPVAPPRMLAGFRDTVEDLSRSRVVAHPSGLTNQYAALPSFHVGWTALACVALAAHLRRLIARALVCVPAVVMAVAVVATGNHFLVDGLAGVTLTLGAWLVLRTVRSHRPEPPGRAVRLPANGSADGLGSGERDGKRVAVEDGRPHDRLINAEYRSR
jgi:hypothetical protein